MRIVSPRSTALLAGLGGLAILAPLRGEEPSTHQVLRVVAGRAVLVEETGAEIENVTAYGLSCHDGTVGPSVRVAWPEIERRSGLVIASRSPPGRRGMHPVGVRYRIGQHGFHAGGPRNDEKVLVAGEVTCIACHDCERHARRLVVSNARSRLCLSCHDKWRPGPAAGRRPARLRSAKRFDQAASTTRFALTAGPRGTSVRS